MSGYLSLSEAESSDMSMELDLLFQKDIKEQEEKENRQIEEIREIKREIVQQQILKEIEKINISHEEIHIFHLKQKGLYNEEEEEIKRKQKYQSIKEIKVNDINELPIQFNIADLMKQLFDDGVLKEWENKSQFDRFKKVCLLPAALELNVLEGLKEKISQEYTLLSTLIPKPKEEFLNPILFVMIYNCHKLMFQTFFQDRKQFNMRLILDCYHLVQFEINGVLTTDFYIQQTIDKYFSVRFLEYEKATKFTDISKKKKMLERGREFLGHVIEVPIPNTQDQLNFCSEIKRILSLGKNNLAANKQNGRLHMIRKLSSCGSSNNNIVQAEGDSSANKRKSSISPNRNRNNGSILSDNSKSQQSFQNIISPANDTFLELKQKKSLIKSKQAEIKKGQDIYENISPSLRIKNSGRDIAYSRLRFNLNHVSPAISQQIDLKDCTLQDTRRQFIFHPIDRFIKSKDYILELEKMKQESKSRQRHIEIKVKEQFNTQLINSEQMRLKVLKGDQEMPSMDLIPSKSDLSSNNSSQQFAKQILKLKLIPKKKDEELYSQAQRHKHQYEAVKQIKQLIDEQGTRVSDLPSSIQFAQKKNKEEYEEEEEQRLLLLNRLYKQDQIIKHQTSITLKEKNILQSEKAIANNQQQIISQVKVTSLSRIENLALASNTVLHTQDKSSKLRSIKVKFDHFKQKSISSSQKLINKECDESPIHQSPPKLVFLPKQSFTSQKSTLSQGKVSNTSQMIDSVMNGHKIPSQFGKYQLNNKHNNNANQHIYGVSDNSNNNVQTKIKFFIEEKQKLDSSVQFLVREQDEHAIEFGKQKRVSSFSPRNNQQCKLAIVRPKDYKVKYNNINYLIESVEDKLLLQAKKRFGINDA